MMDKDERIRRGQEAVNQLNDSLMSELIPELRREILEELAKAEPADTNKIIQLQAVIAVIDSLRERLEAFTLDADDLSSEKQSYA